MDFPCLWLKDNFCCASMKMMRSCDGPGIMALISAALAKDGRPYFPQNVQITDINKLVGLLPSEELKMDCCGNLGVTPSKFAYIDIGEATTRAAYSKAITQLGIRLSVIAWLVLECSGVPDADIRRVGRLFIPLGKRQHIEFKEQKTALEDWAVSFVSP